VHRWSVNRIFVRTPHLNPGTARAVIPGPLLAHSEGAAWVAPLTTGKASSASTSIQRVVALRTNDSNLSCQPAELLQQPV
jgi:hypothetical protein